MAKQSRGWRVRDSAALQSIAAFVGAAYIWFVFRTTRWEYVGRAHLEAAFAASPSFVAAVWHSRLLPIAMLRPRGRSASALISANRDGEILAKVMRFLGADAVRGSSRDPRKPDRDRGGAEAGPKAIAALEAGAVLVITPDGPRGPSMRAKPGVAVLASAAQTPVLPVAYSVRRCATLRTWDRFMAPWPFNRGFFVFGPLIPPAPAGDEAAIAARRGEIEAAMMAVTREADRRAGRETPDQGPEHQPTAAEPDASPAAGAAP